MTSIPAVLVTDVLDGLAARTVEEIQASGGKAGADIGVAVDAEFAVGCVAPLKSSINCLALAKSKLERTTGRNQSTEATRHPVANAAIKSDTAK